MLTGLLATLLLLPATPHAADKAPPGDTALWEHFHDPVLTELVERGIAANPGIDAAKARIEMVEAQARAALAPLHPSVSAEGAYNLRNYSTRGIRIPEIPGMTTTEPPNYMQAADAYLKAQYMVDITGRYYRQRQAALKEVEASGDDADAIAKLLATQIVQTYYDVISAKMHVTLIKEQIQNDKKLLELVMAQFNAGQVSSLDVLQQRQKLDGKRSQLPLAISFLEISRQTLATLLGEEKTDTLPLLPDDLPEIGASPGAVDTETLLAGQPELRAAQTRIEAADDQVHSAKRALMPSLALSGQVGYEMIRIGDTQHGESWSLGALLSIPLYQGGANHATLAQARASRRAAEFNLKDSLLKAKAQVTNSLRSEQEQANYLEALTEQFKASEQTVQESTKHYLAGLSTYLNVLTANAAYQGNQLSLIQARRDLISARINLLSALGGDWTKNLARDNGVNP
jgi:NodT family efflux transporter outer membrane factor (OMF) lipoprotein